VRPERGKVEEERRMKGKDRMRKDEGRRMKRAERMSVNHVLARHQTLDPRHCFFFLLPPSLFGIALAAFVALTLPSCQPSKEAAKPPVRLGPEVRKVAEELLPSLDGAVTLRITRGGAGETAGEEAQALVDLMAELSPKITVEKMEIGAHPEGENLGVPKGPVIEMLGIAPGVLRYYGYPERKETRPFIEGILSASGHPADLSPDVEAYIAGLGEEVVIRIFTTPD